VTAARARLIALAVLASAFAVQLSGHVLHQLGRMLREPGLAEIRALQPSLPGRVIDAPLQGDGKVVLPAAWMGGTADRPRPPSSLLLFVDGRPAHHYRGDPGGAAKAPYGYSRGPRSWPLFVRCPEDRPCATATLVRADARFAAAVALSRLRRSPLHLFALLAGLALYAAAAAWATRGWSPVQAAWGTAAALMALGLWLSLGLQATAWALPVLAAESLAFAAPLAARGAGAAQAGVRAAWAVASSDRRDARAFLARAGFIAATSFAVAAPYIWTGLSWYPADRDDSFLYLRGASRLLADGSLARGAADPSAWVYSLYPLALAALSRLFGVHPMVAYKWLGYAGAALLPAAMGVFAYAVSRRLRIALLACWIAGLWGGLAGYVWLAREAVPALLEGRAPPLLNDDYFEPRFLGEYAGPHSEITSYVCRPPLYPREAALLLFWPALGLAYAGLPRPRAGRLFVFAALTTACTAVYPYYGIPGLLALLALSVLAVRGGPGERPRARWPVAAIALFAVVAVVGLADLMVRLHKSPGGLAAYLAELWRTPAQDFVPSPSLRFTLARVLGGHFFMALAVAAAWALESGRRRLPAWPGFVLFLPSLFLAVAAGVLARFAFFGRFLDPYGWIVPWRTLVEPVIVLGAAIGMAAVADRLGRERRRYLAVPLLLVPALSPLHWTVNADRYLREASARPYGRGRNQELYEEYARLGTALLGRLRLHEPVLVEAPYVGPLEAALGVRAFGAVAQYEPLIVYSEYPEMQRLLDRKRAAGEIGDLAAVQGGAFERRLLARSESNAAVSRIGPYTILRFSPPPSLP